MESESHSVLYNFLQSHGLYRPEYWSGQMFPSPGDLPTPGIESRSPTLHADSLPAESSGKPIFGDFLLSCFYFHVHLIKFQRSFYVSTPKPETGWDLGPFAAVLAPGQTVFSSNKIQRNYRGLKVAVWLYKLETRRYKKTKNPTATSGGSETKARYYSPHQEGGQTS